MLRVVCTESPAALLPEQTGTPTWRYIKQAPTKELSECKEGEAMCGVCTSERLQVKSAPACSFLRSQPARRWPCCLLRRRLLQPRVPRLHRRHKLGRQRLVLAAAPSERHHLKPALHRRPPVRQPSHVCDSPRHRLHQPPLVEQGVRQPLVVRCSRPGRHAGSLSVGRRMHACQIHLPPVNRPTRRHAPRPPPPPPPRGLPSPPLLPGECPLCCCGCSGGL